MTYDDLIMDHIRDARNFRVLDRPDREAAATNVTCGDEMTVYLKLAGERIEDVAFQCTCCGISMASASMMTGMVKHLGMDEARSVLGEVMMMMRERRASAEHAPSPERTALLETVRRFPARARCASLAWAALEAALDGRKDVAVAH